MLNKSDLRPDFDEGSIPREMRDACVEVVRTAAKVGEGVEALDAAVLGALGGGDGGGAGNVGWAVNARQAEALTRADAALSRVVESIEQDLPTDFWTIDLRDATEALGEVSGEDVSEEVLDNIFSRFCIGK